MPPNGSFKIGRDGPSRSSARRGRAFRARRRDSQIALEDHGYAFVPDRLVERHTLLTPKERVQGHDACSASLQPLLRRRHERLPDATTTVAAEDPEGVDLASDVRELDHRLVPSGIDWRMELRFDLADD